MRFGSEGPGLEVGMRVGWNRRDGISRNGEVIGFLRQFSARHVGRRRCENRLMLSIALLYSDFVQAKFCTSEFERVAQFTGLPLSTDGLGLPPDFNVFFNGSIAQYNSIIY